MKRYVWAGLLLIIGGTATALAAVGTGYSLFGQATYVSPGENSNRAVKLVSDASTGAYSGIDFAVPSNLTVSDLNNLKTDYDFTASSCGLGSPRFGIQMDGVSGTVFVYIGPSPNYTNCPQNVWTSTGNLLTPASTVDASQVGGTFYDTWGHVQQLYGNKAVTAIFLVSDSGPGPTYTQTVLIDNTVVNDTVYDYEFASKDDCKKGGWQNFAYAPGPFKNQGQCVSYFARQK